MEHDDLYGRFVVLRLVLSPDNSVAEHEGCQKRQHDFYGFHLSSSFNWLSILFQYFLDFVHR